MSPHEFIAMRKAFEKEVGRSGLNLRVASDRSEYFTVLTQAYWWTWQQAWKASTAYAAAPRPTTPPARVPARVPVKPAAAPAPAPRVVRTRPG